jgi:hypothetical protein
MDGKIEKSVCPKFCVKIGKFNSESPEMLRDAFGEHSLSWYRVLNCIHISRPVECQLKMTNVQSYQTLSKRQKMVKEFKNSSTEIVAEQSMRSQTPLESVVEQLSNAIKTTENGKRI